MFPRSTVSSRSASPQSDEHQLLEVRMGTGAVGGGSFIGVDSDADSDGGLGGVSICETKSVKGEHQQSQQTSATQLAQSERTRLAVSFVYFIFCGVTCAYSVVFGNDRMPLNQPPLRDLVFDLVSPQFWALSCAELILIVQGIVTVVIVTLHRNSSIILRRFLFIFSTLYLLRAICLFSTTLPFPGGDMECSHSDGTPSTQLGHLLSVYFSAGISLFSPNKGYCGNYFFSGHTITITLEYLTIHQYSPKSCSLLRSLSALASLMAALFLVISRGHYTIDILGAYYVTTRLWWNYHALALNPALRNHHRHYPPAKEIWFPLIQYLEHNSANTPETNELCVNLNGKPKLKLCPPLLTTR
ncbi:phosphatidylcholine:ceramide cholinephosphotransferase 1-like [Symsagittifera roscoffensis]|uniref:phosphatidylcholine:ceramide cholinephosphotransferase 1-like n=1 Tax=Symsagittifera roscoffensis TaxID=84072 RepID=UPI00307BF40C